MAVANLISGVARWPRGTGPTDPCAQDRRPLLLLRTPPRPSGKAKKEEEAIEEKRKRESHARGACRVWGQIGGRGFM